MIESNRLVQPQLKSLVRWEIWRADAGFCTVCSTRALRRCPDAADTSRMDRDRSTWLCPHEPDRLRVRENSGRVAHARTIASITVAISAILLAPLLSWWLLALVPLSVVNLHSVDMRMRDSARPEYQAALSVLISQCMLAGAAAITDGSRSPLLTAIAVPTAFAATRFRAAVVWLATGTALGLLLMVALASGAGAALAHPAQLIVAISVTISVTAATQALHGAELAARDTAILDPLTGLLNRHGLERRFGELAEQARVIGAPVSLLVCDLDHFKEINDLHGHAVGDAVLRDAAYTLRKQLRSFELLYRIGGEEFLVVLAGASSADAAALAQRLCEAVRRSRPQGLSLTLSVGVSTRAGNDVDFERLFGAADQALYEAKSSGRDCVHVAQAALKRDAAGPTNLAGNPLGFLARPIPVRGRSPI